MSQPTTVELLPHVMVKEAPSTTALSAERLTIVNKAQEEINKRNEVASFETLTRPSPFEQGKIDRKLMQIGIGIQRDETTGEKKLIGDEQTRYKEAQDASKDVKDFIEKGFEGLGEKKDAFIEMVLTQAELRPLLEQKIKELRDDLDPNKKEAYVRELLNGQNVSVEARRMLEHLLGPDRNFTDVTTKHEDFKQKEYEHSVKETEKETAEKRHKRTADRLKLYEIDEASGQPAENAELAREMKDLEREKEGFEPIKVEQRRIAQEAQQQIDILQKRINGLATRGDEGWEAETARLNGLISDHVARRDEANAELKSMSDKETRLTELKQDKERLEQQLVEQKADLDLKTKELGELKRQLDEKRGLLADAKKLREAEEKDFVSNLQDILKEAVNSRLDQQMTEANEVLNGQLEKLKKETVDADEKLLLKQMKGRYTRTVPKRFGRGNRPEIQKANISKDYGELIDPAVGPNKVQERLLAEQLKTEINPATNAPYTPDEAKVKAAELMKNEEYVKKTQPEMIKQILARRILTGKISQGDFFLIQDSEWGKNMWEQALAQSKDLKKLLEGEEKKLGIQGAALAKSGAERAWNVIKKNRKLSMAALILLLGSFGVPVLGLVSGAAQGALSSTS